MTEEEILRYILKSKTTRQIDSILEALGQTGAGWLIVFAIVAMAVCFFGYKLRRALPFLIGLAVGFAMSCILNKLIVSNDKITLELLNTEITEFINRVKTEGSGFFKTVAQAYCFKSIAIPIISAVVFAYLSALLYRIMMPLYLGVLAHTFAGILLFQSEYVAVYSILIAVGCFLLLLLFYNPFFILLTAASGAAWIGLEITALELFETNVMYIIAVALFALSAACQFVLVYRKQMRKRKKKARAAKAKKGGGKKKTQNSKQKSRKAA